jgi:hypothetical protein
MKSTLLSGILGTLALGASLLLPACSGGGGGTPASLFGTLSVSLTDAPSNKLDSFRVEVSSLDVHKSNFTTIHALAGPLVVDLVDLTDAGQLFSTVPATVGSYSSVTITLDMSTAVCLIAGQSTPATLLNDQGVAFAAPLVVTVNIPSFLTLTSDTHRLIEIDLDLAQSLLIDSGTNTVEFTPAFVVRTQAAQQKPVFLAGTLASVDTLASTFVVEIVDENSTPVCDVTCTSDGATVFQTDGNAATGGAGLNALALLPVGTWIQVLGTIDPALVSVQATSVAAGIGTWNGGTDIVEGVILDRVGGAGADATLTVLGHSTNAAHDAFQFNTTFTVATTLAGTHVVRHASAAAYDTDELDIGQQMRIFGALSGVSMDATTGVVREQPTWIFGSATGAPAGGQLTLSLLSVGLRDVSLFNFPGPTAFVTDVGTLADALALDTGSHVVERGFVTPVGSVGADFTADLVIDADTAPALLVVHNRLSTGFQVTLTPTTGQIDINVSGPPALGEYAILDQGFVGITNLPTSPTPDIAPAGALGLYTLWDLGAGTFTLYLHFPTFSSAVNAAVGSGAQVRHVAAVGSWEPVTSTIHAGLVFVVVQ